MPMTMATITAAMMPMNIGVLSGAGCGSGCAGVTGASDTPMAVSSYELP